MPLVRFWWHRLSSLWRTRGETPRLHAAGATKVIGCRRPVSAREAQARGKEAPPPSGPRRSYCHACQGQLIKRPHRVCGGPGISAWRFAHPTWWHRFSNLCLGATDRPYLFARISLARRTENESFPEKTRWSVLPSALIHFGGKLDVSPGPTSHRSA